MTLQEKHPEIWKEYGRLWREFIQAPNHQLKRNARYTLIGYTMALVKYPDRELSKQAINWYHQILNS